MAKKSQIQKFREAARALESDESESRFNETLKQVARHKPSPQAKRASAKGAKKLTRRNKASLMRVHWSDCAVHNAPAYEPGPCDCGGLELAEDGSHALVAGLVAGSGGLGLFIGDRDAAGFIQPHQLPSHGFVADAAAPDLPDPHYGIARCACPHCVDFYNTGKAVVI